MRLAAKKRPSGYHTLNFIAIDLQLYKILKITRVSFLGHSDVEMWEINVRRLRGNLKSLQGTK